MIDINQVKSAMTGPIGSISTPFHKDNTIDYPGLRNCVDYLVENGSGTLLLTAGDSLYTILTDAEIAEVTKVVVEQSAGRAMVVAASGIWGTDRVVEFARYCKEIGADLLMSAPPNWQFSSTDQTIVKHYQSVAKEMPVMVVTSLEGGPISENVIRVLLDSKDPGVVAIKDDVCGVYGQRLASLINGRWAFLSGGCMFNHLDVMPYGSDGYLAIYMRFKSDIDRQYWKAIKSLDFNQAASLINQFEFPLVFDLPQQLNTGPDALIHASLEIFGIAKRWRREPYSSLNDEQMEILTDFYKKNSLL